ncbi:transposase [Leptolyngbya sp. GGD]|uniref:transposase n=1 Tax=Leptolyngbya sp. GGD TaxID=2997907 RepID=UPI00227A7FD8|nr:transposase [Leptolyngbya sp. GGD]MCY6494616.1 transposase [Leptolyngbya sp. GGD]
MLNLERALNQDRLVRALTELNRNAFDALLPSFEQAYEASRIAAKPVRKRARGGGRKARLQSIEAKLFYILFYFKCYPTFDLAGILFDLDRSQTHEWMHELQPVLEAALGQEMVLPARKLRSIEAFLEMFPGVERVMIDGTERPIQRPQNSEAQTQNYSGKKRRHTRKHLAAVDQSKRVLVLSHAREGKLHDKRFETEEEIAFHIPDEIPIEVDLGFQGLQSEYTNIRIPHKKPRGGELSKKQKQENRSLSQSRVVCENAFAGIKRYGAVSAIYRTCLRHAVLGSRILMTI